MEAQSLPEALRMIMGQRGWSQNRLGRELGVSQGWVWDVLNGRKSTSAARAAKLLARVEWEIRYRPREDDDHVERRSFLAAAMSVTFVPSPKTGPYQDPEYVKGLATRLDAAKDALGGVPLVSAALRHVRNVQGAINSRDRTLQAAASDLARKASLVLADARHSETEGSARLALRLAHTAGHIDGAAHGFENLCTFSDRNGDTRRGAMYAQRGLELPDLSDEQRARLTIRLATALAKAPINQGAARMRLDEARGIDGLSLDSTAMLAGNVGISLGRLGRYEDGYESLGQAVRMFDFSPHMQALYLARQIAVALDAEDPSKAADRMRVLARVLPLIQSSQLNHDLRDIMRKSGRWADAAEMRDAWEQLHTVMSGNT